MLAENLAKLMFSKIRFWYFASSLCILFLNQPDSKAQFPPRIERPVQPNITIPEAPIEPKLEIQDRKEPPHVDIFPNLVVKRFRFINNTVVTDDELQNLVLPYIGKKISMTEIYKIRNKITDLYFNKGYITSGVSILIQDNSPIDLSDATLNIRLNEGEIGEIRISGTKKLARYIKNRIHFKNKVLKSEDLLKDLRLLNDDPLFKKIEANLVPAEPLNRVDLELKVEPTESHKIAFFADNYRNSNVGSFERGVEFTANNPSTLWGDNLSVSYINSNGSDSILVGYTVPVNQQNTTIKVQYSYQTISIISYPGNILDIKNNAQDILIGIRQPILRLASENRRFNLGFGLNYELFEDQNTLLGQNLPVSRGANNNGYTKNSVLSFIQDATYKDTVQVASLKTEFRLGIGLDSSVGPGVNNGDFIIFKAEAGWTRKLPFNMLFGAKLAAQYSITPLPETEQLSLGGIRSIPGYTQDALLTDGGVIGGINVTKVLNIGKNSQIFFTGFFNIGYGYNNGLFDQAPAVIAAPGVQISLELGRHLFGTLTYAKPLYEIGQRINNIQGEGLSLGFRYEF